MADIWNSAGLKLARQLHWRPEVELPAEEAWFLSLSFDEPHSLDIHHPAGLWGEMARLPYRLSRRLMLWLESFRNGVIPFRHFWWKRVRI